MKSGQCWAMIIIYVWIEMYIYYYLTMWNIMYCDILMWHEIMELKPFLKKMTIAPSLYISFCLCTVIVAMRSPYEAMDV